MTDVLPTHGNKTLLYAGGIGAGLLLYMSYRSHAAKSAATTATPTVDTSSGYPVLTSDPLGSSTNPGNTAPSAPVAGPADTNTMWETKVTQALVGQGNSPLDVQRAIEKYFAGMTLSAAESDIINKAIATYGLPPQGTQGVSDVLPKPLPSPTPTPAPTPSPKPPAPVPVPTHKPPVPAPHGPVTHPKPPTQQDPIYTIQHGDTLWGIARRYYGTGSWANVYKIARANGISNPNLIYAGNKIRLPHP